MGLEYKNSKGITYYLHSKGKLFYFSKTIKEGHCEMPAGYEIMEGQSTAMPMLRKKRN